MWLLSVQRLITATLYMLVSPKSLSRCQRVQNAAAHLHTRQREHITPVLAFPGFLFKNCYLFLKLYLAWLHQIFQSCCIFLLFLGLLGSRISCSYIYTHLHYGNTTRHILYICTKLAIFNTHTFSLFFYFAAPRFRKVLYNVACLLSK